MTIFCAFWSIFWVGFEHFLRRPKLSAPHQISIRHFWKIEFFVKCQRYKQKMKFYQVTMKWWIFWIKICILNLRSPAESNKTASQWVIEVLTVEISLITTNIFTVLKFSVSPPTCATVNSFAGFSSLISSSNLCIFDVNIHKGWKENT